MRFVQADLGVDQYIFTRLNKVFDEMPNSASLKHDLFQRPPAPLSGKCVHYYHYVISVLQCCGCRPQRSRDSFELEYI